MVIVIRLQFIKNIPPERISRRAVRALAASGAGHRRAAPERGTPARALVRRGTS